MTANPHLTAQLDDFAALNSPGFALMITAPWGAGKTHAVRKWLGDRDHLYVSLFGIDSLAGVEEALFEAAFVSRQGAKLAMNPTKAVSGLAKGLEGLLEKTTGVSFDASGLVRKAVLADAPSLLVLDDLERAQLDPPRLLSIINRFVEHEGKTVLLLANEDELERAKGQPDSGEAKSDYRRWREKVVGRTITLRPDTQAALDSFLDAITDEGARAALAQRRDAILDVFERSETANLRLLRQSLIECGRFLARVPEFCRKQDKALTSLIGDFLALSVEWHKGDRLTQEDFDELIVEAGLLSEEGEQDDRPERLVKLRARYVTSQSVTLNGQFLPSGVARLLIVEGHATDTEIAEGMLQAKGFSQGLNEEPWQTLWWWPTRDEDAVNAAFAAVRQALTNMVIVEPTVLLQVYGILLGLAKEGLFDLDAAKLVTEAAALFDQMQSEGKLPVPNPSDRVERLFKVESSHGLRFHRVETAEFGAIRDALRQALARARDQDAPKTLRRLLDDLREDPDRFWTALHGGDPEQGIPDVRAFPVFLAGKPREIAAEVLTYPHDRWRTFLEPMKERQAYSRRVLRGDGGALDGERQWLLDFRDRARELAAAATPIHRAQILMAVNHHLAFLDTPSERPNS